MVNGKFAAILQEEFVPNRDPHHGTRLVGMAETRKRQSKRTCTLATIQTGCLPNTNIRALLLLRRAQRIVLYVSLKLGVV